MITWLSKLVDKLSEYLAHRKGLLPIIGLVFILINMVLQLALPPGWLKDTNLFLHIGLIISILGLMLARVL